MFVERIRSLLKEKNIFAKDMLKDLGINKDQLKRWEDPTAIIKPIYVNAIADYLDTTPEYLLGKTDEKETSFDVRVNNMFWDKFLNLCNEKNISPNKMCADLGLSNATATKWKNGSAPRSTTLLLIAEYFDVDISYFAEKETPPEELPAGLDEKDIEIINRFSRLSDEQKRQALSYLEFLQHQTASENQ